MKVRGEVGLSIGYHMISTMCHVDFYCLCGRLMFGRSLGCPRVWVLLTSLRFLFWLHDRSFCGFGSFYRRVCKRGPGKTIASSKESLTQKKAQEREFAIEPTHPAFSSKLRSS